MLMTNLYVVRAVFVATDSGTKLFGDHSFWTDALLSLNIEGRASVLPQIGVSYFVEPP